VSDRDLAPGLLLAMPQLPDPNFQRSVVLLIEHNREGSWGLVVNRPTNVQVGDVLDQIDVCWEGGSSVVWQGGPVESQRGCILHPPIEQAVEAGIEIVPGVILSTLPDQLQDLAGRPSGQLRFLLGYAGWGAGQLEFEISQGSWLSAPASPELVFRTEAGRMWQAAIQSLGIDPTTLVPGVGVH
jgi:putative transcriptional regulator